MKDRQCRFAECLSHVGRLRMSVLLGRRRLLLLVVPIIFLIRVLILREYVIPLLVVEVVIAQSRLDHRDAVPDGPDHPVFPLNSNDIHAGHEQSVDVPAGSTVRNARPSTRCTALLGIIPRDLPGNNTNLMGITDGMMLRFLTEVKTGIRNIFGIPTPSKYYFRAPKIDVYALL